MQRMRVAAASITIIVIISIVGLRDPGPAPATVAIARYAAGLEHLDASLVRLDSAIVAHDTAAARSALRGARAAYKEVELFVEVYGGPALARELNGPPLPHAEEEDPENSLAPVGLQVLEPALANAPEARQLLEYMRTATASLRRHGADTMPGDAYLFDAMRQEIARVATLGLAGFDATATSDPLADASNALGGVLSAIAPYRARLERADSRALAALDASFDSALAQLTRSSAEHFDRLGFISHHVQRMAHALANAQRALGIDAPPKPRAWSARSASIFDSAAFDPMFFAALDAPWPNPNLTALGRDLFFDTRLSPSGERSCATCHDPALAFTDGRPRALLLPGHVRSRSRNTPTLWNAAFQPSLFADNRVRTLEDQAADVVGSSAEMGGSLGAAAARLERDSVLVRRFARSFGAAPDTALSPRTLRLALAAYVRSLTALNSRFDRAVRGDTSAMTEDEREGFELFMGKARCGTCHFAPLFNGATPPTLFEAEPEVIGVPATTSRRHAAIDPDSGRYKVRRIDQHLFAFKTPTLRNVALTAPYMHNGVFATLEAVIDFYNAGGGRGLDINLPHQTLPTDSLRLTRDERRRLVAFLHTLTDTVAMR